MDIRFAPHNTHLDDPENFEARDPHLKQLRQQTLVHRSYLLDELPSHTPGVYTVGGGRQIGKTTLMKQWMALLMQKGVSPERIAYFTGELIDDHHALVRLGRPGRHARQRSDIPHPGRGDLHPGLGQGCEIPGRRGDAPKGRVFLTGSDLAIIKEARMRFPGRRGESATVDFHLYPLSLWEAVRLKARFASDELDALTNADVAPGAATMDRLDREFDDYLIHGGFLTAINDLAKHNSILAAT